jgi:hypothetical protein
MAAMALLTKKQGSQVPKQKIRQSHLLTQVVLRPHGEQEDSVELAALPGHVGPQARVGQTQVDTTSPT